MFPNVKQGSISFENQTMIPTALSVYLEDALCDKAIALISLFLPKCKFRKGDANADIVAKKSDVLSNIPEGYTLSVKNGKTLVEYYTYSGLRNALATFSLIVAEKDGALVVPDTDIRDFPECVHRGMMLDVARGIVPLERLFNDMVLIAKSKYNILHLHLSDTAGVAIALDCLPEEYRIENCYTKKQISEIVSFAELLGLELIPEFDMPAHSEKLNALLPELSCQIEGDNKSLWAVCAGTEAVYNLYEKVISEMIALFPKGRYFHIGGDELDFLDVQPPLVCHWDECVKCKKKMQEENLADKRELYYYFANRINEYVKANGRQMVMWSDQIDCTRPAMLSKDILMQFWRIAAAGRGPWEGCSLQGQLDMGYNMINSFYPNAYVDEEVYLTAENLSQWRWDKMPEISEQSRDLIVGSEICAWEYGNRKSFAFYDHSLPSAIVLAGDKLWSGSVQEYDKETEIWVTRAVLGTGVPSGFNVFDAIGNIYPPRSTEKPCYLEKIQCSKEDVKKVIDVLSDDTRFASGDKNRATAYLSCAEFALKHMQ